MVFFAGLALLLLPASALAGPAEEIATRAQHAHEAHCPEVAGTEDEGDAARAIVEVGGVWAELADVHDATGATWLLYWRGLLAQCIGQDARAVEALIGFVESGAEAEGMAAMVRNARKRLRRLAPDYSPPKRQRSVPSAEVRGRVAGGVALAVGAAGAGVGSSVGFGTLSNTHATLTGATHPAAEAESLVVTGDGQLAAGVGLAVGALAAGVAAGAVFGATAAKVEVAAGVAPLEDGLVLLVGGRW